MAEISLSGYKLRYNIKYDRRRKTVQLKLLTPICLEITVPHKKMQIDIHQIINSKAAWILKHASLLSKLNTNPINQALNDGAQILYLGQPHTLTYCFLGNSLREIEVTDRRITIYIPNSNARQEEYVEKTLKDWYLKKAAAIFNKRTTTWAKKIRVSPQQIRIKDQKTRWGSCSSRGSINYNWRVIMAPEIIIDYLIIHELCHIIIPNHSQKFWALVAQYSPHYLDHRKWLRDNSPLLSRILK